MKQCVQLVPSVTSQEALSTCVTCRVTVFAIERPFYSAYGNGVFEKMLNKIIMANLEAVLQCDII